MRLMALSATYKADFWSNTIKGRDRKKAWKERENKGSRKEERERERKKIYSNLSRVSNKR